MQNSALSTPTQIIIAWTLLGFLLTWLVVFATLALRTQRVQALEQDEVPTGPYPVVNLQVSQPLPALSPAVASASSTFHSNGDHSRDSTSLH